MDFSFYYFMYKGMLHMDQYTHHYWVSQHRIYQNSKVKHLLSSFIQISRHLLHHIIHYICFGSHFDNCAIVLKSKVRESTRIIKKDIKSRRPRTSKQRMEINCQMFRFTLFLHYSSHSFNTYFRIFHVIRINVIYFVGEIITHQRSKKKNNNNNY